MKDVLLKLKQINYLKIIKIAVGSSIAILVADFFGLKYSASAGIITLLSIQDTKKETLFVALKRFLACILAFTTAFIVFNCLGYKTIMFGLFLLIFISLSYLLKLQDGIAMCSVLVTHFLIDKNMEANFILNEFFILMIGTIMGIGLNLYMPSSSKYLKEEIQNTESKIKNILRQLEDYILLEKEEIDSSSKNQKVKLEDEINYDFKELYELLNKANLKAYDNMNNTLKNNTKYYIEYFAMRREQVITLERIFQEVGLLTMIPKQARLISDSIEKIELQFHEYNNATLLIEEFQKIREVLKQEPNPVTREEFENRAILYIILNSLENFLYIKKHFVEDLSEEEIAYYWKMDHKE